MTLALICFDLDNTLWPVDPVIARAEAETWRWLAARAPDVVAQADVDAMRRRRSALLAERPDYMHNLTALRRDAMAATLRDSGRSDVEARALAQQALDVFLEHRNIVTLFPGALELLEKLAGNYRLAALSNGNADLSRMGLSHLFDTVLSAEKVGRAKPDPAMFARAIAEAGVPAAHALHVGDHPEQDVLAAHAHGLGAVWANPLQLERPAQLPAHVPGYTEFAELEKLIAQRAAGEQLHRFMSANDAGLPSALIDGIHHD
jgi:HAD superfamily hydrolase (TIGR01509 family)